MFLHGLLKDQNYWINGSTTLANLNRLTPLRPNTVWREAFSTQAQTLSAALAGVSGVPGIGHSNGGLVARSYVQSMGASSRINRLLTVGTPHGGAPIITNAANGTALALLLEPINAFTDATSFYLQYDPNFGIGGVVDPTLWAITTAFSYLGQLLNQAPAIMQYVGVPMSDLVAPVLPNMMPGSSFLASLNGTSNLSAEQTRLLNRVAISTGISPYEVLLVGVLDFSAEWLTIRYIAQYGALLLWDYYSAHPNPWLSTNAWRWAHTYEALATLDVRWHYITGSYVGSVSEAGWTRVFVEENDGLLPLSRTTYPGAGNILLPSSAFYIRHAQQGSNSTVLNRVSLELASMGVGLRTGPGVSISTPNSVKPNWTCLWSASVSGGVPPYTYLWQVNYLNVGGNSSALTYQNNGSPFRIDLRVTDAAGAVTIVAKNVNVASGAPQCQF
ncbi:MAG: hypothetical protein IT352_18405 [Gemmatimonadales bacterium]|nr:hypothetical protein [Gemmatimonadales bacterium]